MVVLGWLSDNGTMTYISVPLMRANASTDFGSVWSENAYIQNAHKSLLSNKPVLYKGFEITVTNENEIPPFSPSLLSGY